MLEEDIGQSSWPGRDNTASTIAFSSLPFDPSTSSPLIPRWACAVCGADHVTYKTEICKTHFAKESCDYGSAHHHYTHSSHPLIALSFNSGRPLLRAVLSPTRTTSAPLPRRVCLTPPLCCGGVVVLLQGSLSVRSRVE